MASKKKFELTSAIWQTPTDKLDAGTVVTFEDDEPTGIFINRVRELTDSGAVVEVASPDKAGKSAGKVKVEEQATDGSEKMPAETSSDNELPPTPPAPPAAPAKHK
jgi:hypothetical protein